MKECVDQESQTLEALQQQVVKFKRWDQSILEYFQELDEQHHQALKDRIQAIKTAFIQDHGLDLESCIEILKYSKVSQNRETVPKSVNNSEMTEDDEVQEDPTEEA